MARIYRDTKPLSVKEYQEQIGQGISGEINGKLVKLGSSIWVGAEEIATNESRVFVSIDNSVLGYFKITNQYRNEFVSIIEGLRSNYNLHLLSGDLIMLIISIETILIRTN